jgi:hypothetical protein
MQVEEEAPGMTRVELARAAVEAEAEAEAEAVCYYTTNNIRIRY